jgi:AraC-like DNA-binding protein
VRIVEHKIKTISKYDSSIQYESGEMFSFFIHSHTYYEMTLYDPFEGNITVNDHTIYPETTVAILISPSYFHKGTLTGKGGKYRKLAFGPEVLPENLIPQTSIVLKNIKPNSFIEKIYDEISQNSDNEDYKKVLVSTAVCIMLQEGDKILPSKDSSIGIEAVKIINEKFDNHLTLSDVAKELYITPQYLSNVFKAEIDMTFSEYLTSVRLHRAEKLLIETNESITKICENCGYGNFSHFIRTFKKAYGLSPMAYRVEKKRYLH